SVLDTWNLTLSNLTTNNPPIITSPYPSNDSTGIELTPTLNITINDADGDLMNVTWLTNATGSGIFNASHSPVVVNYTTEAFCTRMPIQRNIHYGAGRFWVFFVNGSAGNRSYSSSADGVTWDSPTNIRNSRGGAEFSTWVSGTDIHYVYAYGTDFGGITPKYRMGTLNTNGTITWVAPEQTIIADYNTAYDTTICVDSNGYPWVTWINTSNYHPVVAKSEWNNGSWSMASGFPYELNESLNNYLPIIVPLTNGKVYVVYGFSYEGGIPGPIYGKLWNGTEWSGQENVSTSNVSD
ncbi:unnamed protein product, partial [marine sediment metagenome]